MQGKIDFPLFGKGLYSKGEDFASLGLGSKLFLFIVGPYTLHSTTVKVLVLGIHYSFLNTQHQTYVCSAVQDSPSTSPAYTVQSTTDPVPVLRILYSPLQIKFQSSVYSTAYYRPSTSPPYYVQSTTDPVPILRILYSLLQTVPILRILYNPLETQYQSSVYCTIHYRICSSPQCTLQSTTDPVPVTVFCTVHYRSSTSPPYNVQPTSDQVHVLPLLYSPAQIQYLSLLFSTVHYIQCQPSIYSTAHYRSSNSHPYTKSTTDPVPVRHTTYSPR